MAVTGSPLDLSDEELQASAEIAPERDVPRARQWAEDYFPSPFESLLTAREDPNDPATPDTEDEGDTV